MIKIWLIRHGMTEGNRHQRYIGVTDEPLCPEGMELLKTFTYPKPQTIFVSPLRRCQETAEIFFPGQKVRIIDQLAECDCKTRQASICNRCYGIAPGNIRRNAAGYDTESESYGKR